MKTAEEIFNLLKEKFGDSVIELNTKLFEPFILVNPFEVDKIAYFLRDHAALQFDSLMNLSGVDEADGEKKTDENGNSFISGGNLSVYYHLHSIPVNHKITIKVTVPREKPETASVTDVWRCADWHEREAYDMFGIIFLNHPDLRRILMPYDWDEDSFPLRKDFKLPEFYQGMKIPY
jgi:NADH-quinone oxidoreductase subunit C